MLFKTPILFLIFNRRDTTQKVFDEIKKIKPKYLYIAADGARNELEQLLCQKTRDIINQIDWDCELKTLFQDKNLGCKIAVSKAINWFFDNVEQGIILEDDCLPSHSFFYFCETLLEKYKDNKNIMHISGTNLNVQSDKNYSYYFSNFPLVWGWATWKRSWNTYDVNIKNIINFKNKRMINKIFSNKIIQEYWLNIFNKVYEHKIDTWDYQWTFNLWINKGLSIIPNNNLVTNIGFDERATHTKDKNHKMSNIVLQNFNDLKFPNNIKVNIKDEYNIFQIMTDEDLSLNYTTFIKTLKLYIPKIFKNNIKKVMF